MRNNYQKWFFSLLGSALFLLISGELHAQQIEVDNNVPFTPINLISNVFLGDGVEVTNITFEGDPASVAYFKSGATQVGLDRGVVMTTGLAVTDPDNVSRVGVNAPGSTKASVNNDSPLTNDPDLKAIAGDNEIYDIVRYTITFVPVADTLRFRYTFASEEYPEFVCSPYNDIFGFFISGPGINGPYQNNAANIALIPGTNRPVTINNVNPGTIGTNNANIINCQGDNGSLAYSEYYISNEGSSDFPVYDGSTTVFTAQAQVIPCEEYTIKLVIADLGDSNFDSGVFLEAKSFGTGTVQAEATAVTIDGAIAEGCQAGAVTFTIPDPLDEDLELDYIIGGTAENGRDYETIPTDLVMPAGDTVLVVPVQAIDDGLVENRESITFDVRISQCTRKTYTIYIDDGKLLPPPNLETDVALCVGESTQLQGTSPVNSAPPPFFRSTEEISTPGTFSLWMGTRTSEINVSGVFPDKLGPGVIRSVCIENFEHRWIDDMDFYLIGPDGQYLELTTDNGGDGGNGNGFDYYTNTCFTPTATQRINAPGPFAPPSAVPFTGEWLPEGNWEDFWGNGNNNTNGTYQLLFRDDSFGNAGTLYSWSITFESIYGITYEWSPAAGLSCADCPNPTVQPTVSTDYTFTIRDSYGCEIINDVSVSVPDESSQPDLTCQTVTGSSITVGWLPVPDYDNYEVSVNGGNWTPIGNMTEYTVDNLGFSQTVDFQVRAIGVDCPGIPASLSCTTPDCPTPTASLATTDATCASLADGSVQFTILTGDAPFSYEMMGQTNTTGTFTGLAPGRYSVLVYDVNDCPAIYGFTINALDEVEVVLTIDQEVSCGVNNDGRVIASATGGGGNYSYLWSDGQTTATASGLAAGTYQLSVTSAIGCMQVAEIVLEPPTDMEVSLMATETRCGVPENGTVSLSISDGVPPYTFVWGHDANETSMDLTGMGPGIYEVTVTDSEGCSLIRSAEVMEAEGITLVIDTVSVSCAGGSDGQISVSATGGEGQYEYVWSVAGAGNNAQVSGLPRGTYSVTVTDEFGCTTNSSIVLDELPPLTIDRDFTSALCAGNNSGYIDLKITGGTAPYTFSWNTGASSEDLNNLAAGNYQVTVTDANGCTATDAMAIAEAQPIQASVMVDDVFCNGEATGSVLVNPTSGQPPYVYNWSNGTTDANLSDVVAGTYTLTITDASGCENSFTATVNEPEALTAALATEDISCAGGQDGRIGVTAAGGVPAYSYSLNGNEFKSGTAFIGLTAGDYQVQVRDGNGCVTNLIPATIIEPAPLVVDLGENINVEYGDTLILDSLLITGGTGPTFAYTWTPADSSMLSCVNCLNPTVIVKEQTSFKLLVRDENGCVADDVITIFVNKNNPVMVPTGFTPNGDGNNDLLHVHGKENGTTVRVFRIFDRWGELLHEEHDFDLNDRGHGWDGTFRGQPMNSGVYLWQIEVEYPDGMRQVMSGSTTLIR
ncbi:choice-of-anchor L domain-containing protein [Flavilitoribacter nigricans]|nr:choice-of-anchor L domain-containing protein [Flavilitoribacter nigricans]